MNQSVLLLPEAESNITEAARWWAENRSAEQAIRWYDAILDAIESLAASHDRYPLAREDAEFEFDLRAMPFSIGPHPTHRVLYTLRPNTVVVLSVRHTSQQDLRPGDV
jgi:plasmid stabilization system protein ParE